MSLDREREAELYYKKAVEFHKEHKKKQAIEYYEQMIAICEDIERKNVLVNLLEHLIKLYEKLEDPKKAEEYSTKLVKLKK